VFKRLFISLTCALASWSSAEACSFSSEALSGQANYRVYHDRLSDILSSDKSYITIIKTEAVSESLEEVSIYGKKELKPFVELDIQLIENLLGEAPDYSNHYLKRAPKFSEKKHAAEVRYASKPRPFGFWDQLSLSNPKVSWHGSTSSCGFSSSSTLDADTYYIAIKGPRSRGYFEPITGLDDPLINDFRDIVRNATTSKIKRSAQNFFKRIDGYQDITITQCPVGTPAKYGKNYNTADLVGEKAFKSKDSFKSDLTKITMTNFFAHDGWSGYDILDTCRVGDNYLVIESKYSNYRNFPQSIYMTFPADLRFLKIESGHIDTSKVKSNVKITGQNIIPASHVKSWIREANDE